MIPTSVRQLALDLMLIRSNESAAISGGESRRSVTLVERRIGFCISILEEIGHQCLKWEDPINTVPKEPTVKGASQDEGRVFKALAAG